MSEITRRELAVLGVAEVVEGIGHIIIGNRMPNLALRVALS